MDLQFQGEKAIMAGGSAGMGRAALLFAACPDPDILAITIKPPSPTVIS